MICFYIREILAAKVFFSPNMLKVMWITLFFLGNLNREQMKQGLDFFLNFYFSEGASMGAIVVVIALCASKRFRIVSRMQSTIFSQNSWDFVNTEFSLNSENWRFPLFPSIFLDEALSTITVIKMNKTKIFMVYKLWKTLRSDEKLEAEFFL